MNKKKLKVLLLLVFALNISSCSNSNSETIITDDDDDQVVTSDCDTNNTENQSTNSEIEAMRQAMLTFRNSLSSTLLSESSTCLTDERFYLWHNTPNSSGNNRDGIIYGDLTADQLDNFKSLMQLFLSTNGYKKVSDITELAEGYLSEQNSSVWHPDFYSIDLFGDPESVGSWGFQLDGHHIAINFLVHGDNVSIVPAFLGGEPAVETYNGTAFDIFEEERELALNLYNNLTSDENNSAVSTGDTAMEVGPAASNGNVDPYRGDYDYSGFANGLKYSDMSSDTQANLVLLMKEYVYTMTTTFADVWWGDIIANINDTYFVWRDEVASPNTTSPFYYRIYNPYLWVEYNAEDALGGGGPDYNHVHTITRIPNNPATDNEGDYGVFASMINKNGPKTLYEHYSLADHHKMSTIKFDYQVKMKSVHNEHSHEHSHTKKEEHSHSHEQTTHKS